MQVYSRLATGKFPDFPATAAMVAKVFPFFNLHHLYLVLATLMVANEAANTNTSVSGGGRGRARENFETFAILCHSIAVKALSCTLVG